MKKTAEQIFKYLDDNPSFFGEATAKLQAFLDEGEEPQPPQSFTTGLNDMIECKGVAPEVAMTLPPFEEWWEGLDPHGSLTKVSFRSINRHGFNIKDANEIYNSLASQLKPISDEEVVRLWNLISANGHGQAYEAMSGKWITTINTKYRLKPPPAKEDWEVAWEHEAGLHLDLTLDQISKLTNAYRKGFEAGQKEKGDK